MKNILIISILLITFDISYTQVAVVANKSAPVDHISDSELLDYYTGDIRKWKNGDPVVVFDLKPRTPVKDAFYDFLGKSSSRMKSIWMKKKLSGEGDPPQAFGSEEEILTEVASTPGAIGFVSKVKVGDNVKILRTIKLDE